MMVMMIMAMKWRWWRLWWWWWITWGHPTPQGCWWFSWEASPCPRQCSPKTCSFRRSAEPDDDDGDADVDDDDIDSDDDVDGDGVGLPSTQWSCTDLAPGQKYQEVLPAPPSFLASAEMFLMIMMIMMIKMMMMLSMMRGNRSVDNILPEVKLTIRSLCLEVGFFSVTKSICILIIVRWKMMIRFYWWWGWWWSPWWWRWRWCWWLWWWCWWVWWQWCWRWVWWNSNLPAITRKCPRVIAHWYWTIHWGHLDIDDDDDGIIDDDDDDGCEDDDDDGWDFYHWSGWAKAGRGEAYVQGPRVAEVGCCRVW